MANDLEIEDIVLKRTKESVKKIKHEFPWGAWGLVMFVGATLKYIYLPWLTEFDSEISPKIILILRLIPGIGILIIMLVALLESAKKIRKT